MAWMIRHAYCRDCNATRGGSTRLVPSPQHGRREPWLLVQSLGQPGECVLSPPGCCVSPLLAEVLYIHPPSGPRHLGQVQTSCAGQWWRWVVCFRGGFVA